MSDVEGNPLDGEWVNPASLSTVNTAVSEFPSGDGVAGGDFNFVATLLGGDATLDNVFDAADYIIFNESWMSGLVDAMFTDGDANGDGYVNSADWPFMPSSLGLNLQNIWILADLNGDLVVDEQDGDIMEAHFGMANPTQADGDLDGDGDVDTDDLDLMFAQYGLALSVVS